MGIAQQYNPVYARDVWTPIATFSATSAVAAYPASNLGGTDFNRVWRSTSIADQVLSFTLSRAVLVGMVVLGRHNLTQGASYRLRLYSDAAWTTLIYDSAADADNIGGSDIWPTVYSFDQLDFEDDNCWTWKYRTDEMNERWDRPIWLRDQRYFAQSGTLTLSNPFNQDGYLQAGYLEISRAQQLSRGLAVGNAASGYDPASVITAADGGKEYGLLKQKPRVFQGTFPLLPRDEADLLKENKRFNDIVPERPFFFHPFPRDIARWSRNSFFARNNELGLHQISTALRDAVPLSLRECL